WSTTTPLRSNFVCAKALGIVPKNSNPIIPNDITCFISFIDSLLRNRVDLYSLFLSSAVWQIVPNFIFLYPLNSAAIYSNCKLGTGLTDKKNRPLAPLFQNSKTPVQRGRSHNIGPDLSIIWCCWRVLI